ncbi:MAG: translation initiation factor IF-2 associated domain-containing protein, partial [Alphaproteobacteria bacterium]|nr:translation initiation factor IF-2 associated domain-containing protein [Alphaproteobacteria bacterium]
MSEKNSKPKKLSLSGSGKLTLGGGGLDQTALRSGVSANRGKNVQVEVRRKRVLNPALRATPSTQPETLVPTEGTAETSVQIDDRLTAAERANRIKVLQE